MKGTGQLGAGLSLVINPEMKWTLRGAGMRTGRVGHQMGLDSATMVSEVGWEDWPSVDVLGSLQEFSHFMFSCQ